VILALVLGGAGSTWQAIVAGHARDKADLASTRAIASAKSAEAATRRAEQQEQAMRRRAYAADMNVAHQALQAGNLGRARELLGAYRPEEGQADLRGWEWRYLWGLCQSHARFELCRLSTPVISTAIRPGGNWIAIGGDWTGDVEVWDLSTRRRVARLTSGEYHAHVAFSPDGSRLAFATREWLRVWDCATQKMIAEVSLDHPAAGSFDNIVLSVSFSADGETIITFHRSTAIKQWRASDLEVLNSRPIPIGEAWQGTPFAVSSDLKTAVHVEDPNGIVVIDLESGQERWRYKSPSQYAVAIAISPDGKLLATNFGFSDGTIQIRDVATGEPVTELVGHRAWVSTLKFWPDGKTLASASADHTIRIWDMERFEPIRTLQGHTLEVWSLDLSSDGSTLVSGSKNGEVLVWDSKGDSRKPSAWTVPGRHHRFRLSSDGAAIHALQQERRQVMRYHGPTFGREEVIEEIPIGEDATCCISQSGRLATLSDGVLRVWNLDERKLANEVTIATVGSGQSQPLAFSADERRFWIHHWDADVNQSVLTEWDLAAKLPFRTIADLKSVTKYSRVQIHPNNWAIFTGWTRDDGWVGFHDLRTGRTTWPEKAPGPAIPFGPFASSCADGKLLAICHDLGILTVWETASLLGNSAPRPIKTLGGILKMFHGSAFSPDGTRLLAGSGGAEAIKLWETRDYHEVLTLEGNGDSFQQISFSADGNILGATNAQGQLHFWRAPTWEEINAVEKAAEGAGSGEFTPVFRQTWEGELLQ
jgi:WD40 repeat protein